jgi:YVTN family beta-propeller protein
MAPRVIRTIRIRGLASGLEINPLTNRLYFSRGTVGISVLNTHTNRIIRTLRVDQSFNVGAINFRTNRIYLVSFFLGMIAVVNGRTNRIIARIRVGRRPSYVVVNPIRNLVYVSRENGVVVIDGRTNRIRRTIRIPSAYEMSINTRTNRIYVTTDRDIAVIDGRTHRVIARIRVGSNPMDPVVNPRTNRIYVGNNMSRFLTVINGRTNRRITNLQLGKWQNDVQVNPITNRIYVTGVLPDRPGTYYAINGRTNRIIARRRASAFPYLFLNPVSNHVYLADSVRENIAVMNGRTNRRISTLRVVPGSFALHPRTNRVYVGDLNRITVIQDRA